MNVTSHEIKELLIKHKKICVYGLSPDTNKPSFTVPAYMRSHGWDIVGVYPKKHHSGEFKIYTKLSDVPSEYLKFVDVFRASDKIPGVVEEVLALGKTELLWLQLGITHPEAERRAENAGLHVISNRCPVIEHRNF